ncbi:MAG: hypothetical protein E7033_08110 [Akkermansiaceae bacterium]|nr:hypothetical protein [Akkermansiaceae bacterium]
MRRFRRIVCWACLALVVLVAGGVLYSSIRPERFSCFLIVNIQDTDFEFGWLQESQWSATGVLDCRAAEGGFLNEVVSQALLQHLLHNHGWHFCGTSADAAEAACFDTRIAAFREQFPQYAHAELDLYDIETGYPNVLWCKAVVHRSTGHVLIDMSGKW